MASDRLSVDCIEPLSLHYKILSDKLLKNSLRLSSKILQIIVSDKTIHTKPILEFVEVAEGLKVKTLHGKRKNANLSTSNLKI